MDGRDPPTIPAPTYAARPTFSLRQARKSLFISVTATLSCGLLGPLTVATMEFRLIRITWDRRREGGIRAHRDGFHSSTTFWERVSIFMLLFF